MNLKMPFTLEASLLMWIPEKLKHMWSAEDREGRRQRRGAGNSGGKLCYSRAGSVSSPVCVKVTSSPFRMFAFKG